MAPSPNPLLLAAENSSQLLPLLHQEPQLALVQDEHGYSLLHAAASYNLLDLMRTLVQDFHVDVNIKDEDDETPLFVVESPEAAKVLVEELAADIQHRGSEGLMAREKIEAEGDWPAVATYLHGIEASREDNSVNTINAASEVKPPPGMKLTVSTLDPAQDIPSAVDTDFRRRIEALAQREDFSAPSGQADLRRLVEDAVVDQELGGTRNVRPKT